jgi:hypothetical protein
MNDSDLRRKLRNIPVPDRTDEYWENFPTQMSITLRRFAPRPEPNENYFPRFALKLGMGLACIILSMIIFSEPLKAASNAVFQKEKFIHQQLTALPRQLHVLMADEHGLHYLIADKE